MLHLADGLQYNLHMHLSQQMFISNEAEMRPAWLAVYYLPLMGLHYFPQCYSQKKLG